ncbi:MAG: glycoside-pentoside-hexuronide (GPH):cation symporter [Arcanobacterium sp.]|nr:glycoside-pentoside-hexuronide (GPH):cation symporter [Arcanobacterium sp.]
MNQTLDAEAKRVRPFGFRDKLGYMFGDLGNDFSFMLQTVFFMIFYTNVVGVNPAYVGTLFLVARITDGFTDVLMGVIVDRMPVTKKGTKFKRWIKYVMIPVAVASSLMFMSFVADFNSETAKIVWMCATYFLWGSVCYTAINIPYGCMASVISPDPDHRAQLSVWRSTGANIAFLLVSSLLPLVVYTTNAAGVSVLEGPRMTIGAIICSVCSVLCYLLTYFLVEERVVEAPASKAEDKHSIGDMVKAIFTNRALGGLVVAALLLLIANLFLSGMLGYLCVSYFNNGKLQSIASAAGLLPSFALIVLAPWMAKKWGKTEVGTVAMIVAGVIFVAAWILHISSPGVWIVFYAVGMFAITTFNFLVWAFIIDVIDYQEVQTGYRDDGTVYAVYSWARKLGQALSGGLTGWALAGIGYNADAAKAGVAQAQSVLDSLYMLGNLVPGIGCILVGLALWFLYPLKKKVVEANAAELAARRAAQAEIAAKGIRG